MPIEAVLKSHAVTQFGVTRLRQPLSIEFYAQWIEANKHGEMSYLKEHLETKRQPQTLGKGLKSAIVIAEDYFPHPKSINKPNPLRTAMYAQGEDYHFWFKEKLQGIADELKKLNPNEEFLVFTDSGPVLERDLAFQASLGWVGKNTCVIHPKKGSLFFIGEILTSLELENTTDEIPDFCGTCNRCIEVCPTKAISPGKDLDARKCISYWTIESRQVAPAALRSQFQDWFFGCDLCQSVCPWNEKVFSLSKIETKTNSSLLLEDLRFFLTASGKQIEKRVLGTPLKRAGPFGLRRNALVVIGNLKLRELQEQVSKWLDDPRLGELAHWTLDNLR